MNTDQSGGIFLNINVDDSAAAESFRRLRSRAGTAGREIEQQLSGLGDSVADVSRRAESGVSGIGGSLKAMAAAAGVAFGVGAIKQFATSVINVRKEIESLEISFRSLLGSKEAGDTLFQEIKEFAVKTPMMLGDLAKGAQTLLGFGTAADKVMPIMKALGDISMGDAQRFQALTLAFAQASASGKLMGQDLMQMINAGFQPLAFMAQKTGKSIGELKDEMSKGLITAAMLEEAVMDATAAGGKYHGMLEEQSKGLSGSISNLSGAVQDMLNEIGESSQGVISDAVAFATLLVKNYEKVGKALLTIVVGYGAYRAALAATIVLQKASAAISYVRALQATTSSLSGATKAQLLLNQAIGANPYVKLASILITVAGLIWAFASSADGAGNAAKRLSDATNQLSADLYAETSKVDRLFARLRDAKEGTEEYAKVKEAILAQYGSLLGKYNDEIKALKDVEGAYRAVTIAVEESVKAKSMAEFEQGAVEDLKKESTTAMAELERIMREAAEFKAGNDLGGWTKPGAYKKVKAQAAAQAKADAEEIAHLLTDLKEPTEREKAIIKKYDSIRPKNSAPWEEDTAIEGMINKRQKKIQEYQDRISSMEEKLFGKSQASKVEAPEAADPSTYSTEKVYEELFKQQKELNEAVASGDVAKEEATKRQLAIYEQILSVRKEEVNTDDALTKRIELLGNKLKGLDWGSAEYKRVKSDLDAAEKLRKEHSKTGGSKGASTAETAAQRQERLDKAEEKYNADRLRQARDFEIEKSQAVVDGMKDGLAKELAQNELSYQKRLKSIAEQESKMIESLRDFKELQFKAAHPKAVFDRSTVSRADLSDADKGILKESTRLADESRNEADKKTQEQAITDIQTYSQKRLKIMADYQRREEELYTVGADGSKRLMQGVTEGNIEALRRKAQEALDELDVETAQRDEEYNAFVASLTEKSLLQIKDAVAKAKEQLKAIESDPKSTDKQKAVASAKVKTLEKTEKNLSAEQNVLSPNERTIKQWQELYSALKDIEGEFESIGEAVGGVAGEAIKAAGGIASSSLSMINGIITLANTSATATAGTAAAASSAVKMTERASIILGIISAALAIATRIAAMFDGNKERDKRIAEIGVEISALDNYISDELGRNMQRNGVDIMAAFNEELANAPKYIKTTAKAWSGFTTEIKGGADSIRANAQLHEATAKKLAAAYRDMAYGADKAIGSDRYKVAQEAAEAHAKKMLALQAQLDEERKKKDRKRDRAKEAQLEEQIREEGYKAKKAFDDIIEEIIGTDLRGLADKLGDALIEAFARGEDAAKAWGSSVNDIVKGMLRRILIQQLIEAPLLKVVEEFKQKWNSRGRKKTRDRGQFPTGGGQLRAGRGPTPGRKIGDEVVPSEDPPEDLEETTQMIMEFMQSLIATGAKAVQDMEGLNDKTKGMLMDLFGIDREASKKGIAAASQDSIDELNGRMTSVQAHTFSIAAAGKSLVETSSNILRSVTAIEYNTARIIERIDNTNREVNALRKQVETAAYKGFKMR